MLENVIIKKHTNLREERICTRKKFEDITESIYQTMKV
jgi:hypothetical protein